MLVIYVGDSMKNLIRRIKTNHCSGNVEASAFRKSIAVEMGYKIKMTKRKSGSTRVRIDLPDDNEGEKLVSAYVQSGFWKYVFCLSPEEARDFQFYVIDHLHPILNKGKGQWNRNKENRFRTLYEELIKMERLSCMMIMDKRVGPGVYIFYNNIEPKDFK